MLTYREAAKMTHTQDPDYDDFLKGCVSGVVQAAALKCTAVMLKTCADETDTNKVMKTFQAEVLQLRSCADEGGVSEKDVLHKALCARIRSALAFKPVPNK